MPSPKTFVPLMLIAAAAAVPAPATAASGAARAAQGDDGCPAILGERRDRARSDLNSVNRSISSSTRAVARYSKAKKNAKTKSGRAKAGKKLAASRKRLKISKAGLPNIQRRFDAAQKQAVEGGCAP